MGTVPLVSATRIHQRWIGCSKPRREWDTELTLSCSRCLAPGYVIRSSTYRLGGSSPSSASPHNVPGYGTFLLRAGFKPLLQSLVILCSFPGGTSAYERGDQLSESIALQIEFEAHTRA
jgi:hypothetical protein